MIAPVNRFFVSHAELQVFQLAYEEKRAGEKEPPIMLFVRKALEQKAGAFLNPDGWDQFKALEFKLLGPSSLTETFERQMGIEPRERRPDTWEFDDVAFKSLLSLWGGKTGITAGTHNRDIFQQLAPFDQKLLLKALAHFSTTREPMRVGRGLTEHDLIILHSLRERIGKITGTVAAPYDINAEKLKTYSYLLYKELYAVYKSGLPEERAINAADKVIKNARDAAPEFGGKATKLFIVPDQKEPTPLERRFLYRTGEKWIGGEVRQDLKHLTTALAELKVRADEDVKDPKLADDIGLYFDTCRLAIVRAEAQVAHYKPYMNDSDMTFLLAKALANLSQLRRLEADALELMGKSKSPGLKLAEDFLKDAIIVAERAAKLGNPKGGILVSAFTRQQKGKGLTGDEFERAEEDLQAGLIREDVEALREDGMLYSAAWRAKVPEKSDDAAIDILRPLGRDGAKGLRTHFEAGSTQAGVALLELMDRRLEPETTQQKFQRFWNALISFFSLGSVGEGERFLSRDPHTISAAEIDFAVEASLAGVPGVAAFLDKCIQTGRGPKIPLLQAQQFLLSLEGGREDKLDPRMAMNGREAYRRMEKTARMLLDSLHTPEEKSAFADKLERYLNRMMPQSGRPYRVLSDLLNQLRPKPAAVEVTEAVLTPEASVESFQSALSSLSSSSENLTQPSRASTPVAEESEKWRHPPVAELPRSVEQPVPARTVTPPPPPPEQPRPATPPPPPERPPSPPQPPPQPVPAAVEPVPKEPVAGEPVPAPPEPEPFLPEEPQPPEPPLPVAEEPLPQTGPGEQEAPQGGLLPEQAAVVAREVEERVGLTPTGDQDEPLRTLGGIQQTAVLKDEPVLMALRGQQFPVLARNAAELRRLTRIRDTLQDKPSPKQLVEALRIAAPLISTLTSEQFRVLETRFARGGFIHATRLRTPMEILRGGAPLAGPSSTELVEVFETQGRLGFLTTVGGKVALTALGFAVQVIGTYLNSGGGSSISPEVGRQLVDVVKDAAASAGSETLSAVGEGAASAASTATSLATEKMGQLFSSGVLAAVAAWGARAFEALESHPQWVGLAGDAVKRVIK